MQCPECHNQNLSKEGFATIWKNRQRTKQQRWRCKDCGIITIKPVMDKHKLICLRCGHEWTRKQEQPKRCPKCKTPYWDSPRKSNDTEKEEKCFG